MAAVPGFWRSGKKQQLYESRFGAGGHFHLGDVWNSDEVLARISSVPFLATASFPCIDLSLAGHWKGFEGEHSSTFFGFAKVLEAMGVQRPKVVMLENVQGFITSQDGRDFESPARALAELGYWIDAFIVDAKYFLPQSRPRVFVIGMQDIVDSPLVARKTPDDWFSGRWSRHIERAGSAIPPQKLLDLMERIELPTGWAALNVEPPPSSSIDLSELIDLDDGQEW
jgi:DNA (cytosine-5)-methyltransferase 1